MPSKHGVTTVVKHRHPSERIPEQAALRWLVREDIDRLIAVNRVYRPQR